jgi:CBS domain-containing protein
MACKQESGIMKKESIERFIHKKIVVLTESSTVLQAARAMDQNRIGCIIVNDHKGHIVGLITDRDIACFAMAYGFSPETSLLELMTEEPIGVTEESTLQEVIMIMEENGIRRVPVFAKTQYGKDKCVGIITLDDLIVAKAIDPTTLARIVESQVMRRRHISLKVSHKRPASNTGFVTTNRFDMSIESLGDPESLSDGAVQAMRRFVLVTLAASMEAREGLEFLRRLPETLRVNLSDLPMNKGTHSDVQTLLDKFERRFRLSKMEAKDALSTILKDLPELVGPNSMKVLGNHCSADWRPFLKFAEKSESGGVVLKTRALNKER